MLILDEAVSALDKSVEAQVLNLLRDAEARSFNLTYVFISHDLQRRAVHLSDRVLVMYLGQVVEMGPVEAIYAGRQASLHARRCSARGLSMDPDDRDRRAAAHRRSAQPDQPALGLPLPHPLPVRRGRVRAEMPALGAWLDRASHLAACHMARASGTAGARRRRADPAPDGGSARGQARDGLAATTSAQHDAQTRPLVEVEDLDGQLRQPRGDGAGRQRRRLRAVRPARCCASSASPARARS